MTEIKVDRNAEMEDGFVFDVEVFEGDSASGHTVEMLKVDYERITDGSITPEQLIQKSFEFLLDREPKESILSRFNLSVISNYFPNYEEEIKGYF